MSGRRVLLWATLAGVGMVVIFAQLLWHAAAPDDDGHADAAQAHAVDGHGAAGAAVPLPAPMTRLTVDRLPCFDCHALAHYLHGAPPREAPLSAAASPTGHAAAASVTTADGEQADEEADDEEEGEDDDEEGPPRGPFSHVLHAEEGVGHCHKCHAFKGHFQVVTREATCEECH